MSKNMRGNPFPGNGGDSLGSGADILAQPKAESRSRQRRSVSIHEYRLVGLPRLSPYQRRDQIGSFRPDRRDALFAALAHEANMGWRLEVNILRPEIERLLNASPGVVKQG